MWIAPSDSRLANADSKAGTQRGHLRQVIVAAECEKFARHRQRHRIEEIREWQGAVESDERVVNQVFQPFRVSESLKIAAMSMKSERNRSGALGQQSLLLGTHHADRDVGVAPQ